MTLFLTLARANARDKRSFSKSFKVKRGVAKVHSCLSHLHNPSFRYVQELVKMKDTFIDPLLHPYSTLAAASTTTVDYDYYRAESPFESADDLLPPIAARFMSPVPSMNPRPTSSRTREITNVDGDSGDTDEDETYDKAGKTEQSRNPRDTRSPYRATMTRTAGRSTGAVPFPSRSHTSLPHPPPAGEILYPRRLIRWVVSLPWLNTTVCASSVKIHPARVCCENSGKVKQRLWMSLETLLLRTNSLKIYESV
jgi:hypothetical protein